MMQIKEGQRKLTCEECNSNVNTQDKMESLKRNHQHDEDRARTI